MNYTLISCYLKFSIFNRSAASFRAVNKRSDAVILHIKAVWLVVHKPLFFKCSDVNFYRSCKCGLFIIPKEIFVNFKKLVAHFLYFVK